MEAISNFFNFTKDLDEELVAEIHARCSGPRTYQDEETLFFSGESPDHLFQIVSGNVEVRHFSLEGQAVNITRYHPGDWCGDVNIIDGRPRLNTGLAVGETKVLVLSREDFHELCDKHTELLRAFCLKQAITIRILISMLVDFSVLQLSDRLVRTLLRLLLSQGKQDDSGEQYIECSQEEVARYLGVSRQSASTELKKLEKLGVIRIAYGKIYVPDTQALNETCDSQTSFEPVGATYRP